MSNTGMCYQRSCDFVEQKNIRHDKKASKDSEDDNVFTFSVTQLEFDIII